MGEYSRYIEIFIAIWYFQIFKKKKRKLKIKTCTFAGHANISNKEEIKVKLKDEIINLVEKESVTTFCSGGKGAFDWLRVHIPYY